MIHDSCYINKGFSLLEVVVTAGIFLAGAIAITSLLTTTLKLTADEQARTGAFAVIEQQLELARNLPYTEVGVAGGIPSGSLPQTVTRIYNNIPYTLTTRVDYVDDPFDGVLGGNPADLVSTDYKRVRVSAGWQNQSQTQTVTLLTDIAPPGLENTPDGGALDITVLSAAGPVPQATVTINNQTVNPPVNLTLLTNDQGQIILPGTKPAADSYALAAAKSGYSTERTYAPNPPTLTTPNRPHLSVVEGQTSPITFNIDRLGTLSLTVRDENGNPLGRDIPVTLSGSNTIGNNPNPAPPPDTVDVLKYPPQPFNVRQSVLTVRDLEPDTYTFSNLSSEYDLAAANPPGPTVLPPSGNVAVAWTMAPHAAHTLLLSVQKPDGTPLPDAAVTLTQNLEPVTKITGLSGQTFFTPLVSGSATIEVNADDYQTYTDTITISGQTTATVKMNL